MILNLLISQKENQMGRGKDKQQRIRRTKEEMSKGVPLEEVKRVRSLSVNDNDGLAGTEDIGDFQPEQNYTTDTSTDSDTSDNAS